jgi:hypothetical protein
MPQFPYSIWPNSPPLYGGGAYGYTIGYFSQSWSGGAAYGNSLVYSSALLHGEYIGVDGSTTWAPNASHALPASLYLSAKPSWWSSSIPYPAIGPDVTGGIGPGGHAYAIPAEAYYNAMGGSEGGAGSPLTFDASNYSSSSTFTIGGSISGLSGTVVLQDNGGDNLSNSTNGSFTFATATSTGGTYNVTVLTQPTGQTCTVSNGSGTVASANVTNVSVSCADTAAPSVPAGLSATSTSASQINLSWSTSTDTGGSGLAGYKIYRCTGSSCTPTSQVATSTPASFSDTGLSGSTSYCRSRKLRCD